MMRTILELSWLWKFLSVFAAIAFVIAAVWLMQLARTPMPI